MRALQPFSIASAIIASAAASSAQAAYKIDIQQVGANVVASGSGSINLDALTFWTGSVLPLVAQVGPFDATAGVGSGNYLIYTGFSGPSSFGSGGTTFADSYTGAPVMIFGSANELGVPGGPIHTCLEAPSL